MSEIGAGAGTRVVCTPCCWLLTMLQPPALSTWRHTFCFQLSPFWFLFWVFVLTVRDDFFNNISYAVNDIKYYKPSVCCFWMTRHSWDRISVGVENCRYTDQGSTGHCRLGKQPCRHSGRRWFWMKVTVGNNYVGCNQWWILGWSFASQDCIFHGWGPCSGGLTALLSLGDGTSPWALGDRTDTGSRTQPMETCHCCSIWLPSLVTGNPECDVRTGKCEVGLAGLGT